MQYDRLLVLVFIVNFIDAILVCDGTCTRSVNPKAVIAEQLGVKNLSYVSISPHRSNWTTTTGPLTATAFFDEETLIGGFLCKACFI